MEELLIIAFVVGIPAGWVWKACGAWLDDLDFATEKQLSKKLKSGKEWAIWVVTCFATAIIISSTREFDRLAANWLRESTGNPFLWMMHLTFWFLLSLPGLLALVPIWLFVRRLIVRTSPSIAWRALLCYVGLTLSACTFVALVAGYLMNLMERKQRRDRLRNMFDLEMSGVLEINRL